MIKLACSVLHEDMGELKNAWLASDRPPSKEIIAAEMRRDDVWRLEQYYEKVEVMKYEVIQQFVPGHFSCRLEVEIDVANPTDGYIGGLIPCENRQWMETVAHPMHRIGDVPCHLGMKLP